VLTVSQIPLSEVYILMYEREEEQVQLPSQNQSIHFGGLDERNDTSGIIL
jgi:hypothetical protein